jgi:predicted RNA binding protein YcfA (HicA-like mRNA interferase family)
VLPKISGKAVVQVLQREGYVLLRIRGSHHYLRKPGATTLAVVPVHGNRDLPSGTLRAIIRQAGMTVDEFVKLITLR